MKLVSGEPHAEPWQVMPIKVFIPSVFDIAVKLPERPWILAVDGRSASGKSTLAKQLNHHIPRSAIVHTDDIAWHHSFFDWSDLLIEEILQPIRAGQAVSYIPPGWKTHNRSGSIDVAANLDLLIIEGVGASRTEMMPFIDRSIWVQSDFDEARRRGIERDGGNEDAIQFWDEWMAAELVFLAEQRPWERATVIVNGSYPHKYDRDSAMVVSSKGG